MLKPLRTVLILAGVLIVAFVLYSVLSTDVEPEDIPPEQPAVSQSDSQQSRTDYLEAPSFTAFDADGNEVSLSDYFGAPIVLNFWASWCGPCKTEMPAFEAVAAEYEEDELVFIMLNMTGVSGETRADAEGFLSDGGYTFRVWYDENQQGYRYYGIDAFPTTVFIKSDGGIYGAVRGSMTERKLRSAIDKLFEADAES